MSLRRLYLLGGSQVSGDVSVALTGLAATSAQDPLVPLIEKGVTGLAATTAQGALTLTISKALTGQAATTAQGALVVGIAKVLTGLAATTAQGTLTIAGGLQILHPTANGSVAWTPSAGTNWECVDEEVASDSDYVYAETAGLLDSYEVPTYTDPGFDVGFTIRYRVKLAQGGLGVEARLYEGTTLRSSDPVQRFVAGDYEWVVDAADIANVTDPAAVRIAIYSV